MKTHEFMKVTKQLLEARVAEATEKMKSLPKCYNLYASMCDAGYKKQAEVFKNIVFLDVVINPTKADDEIVYDFAKKLNII